MIRALGLSRFVLIALKKLFNLESETITIKRKVRKKLLEFYGHKVSFGRMTGTILPSRQIWGGSDLSSKILGTYEASITEKLVELASLSNGVFIDIGSADGYYSIGMLHSKTYEKCLSFEISEQSRNLQLELAKLNRVEDNITILNEANIESLSQFQKELEGAIILIDIEGEEYELLTDQMLKTLRNSHIIIELHPHLAEGQSDLFNRVTKYFKCKFIPRAPIDLEILNNFPDFSDDERLLTLSEGRNYGTQWILLEPLQNV